MIRQREESEETVIRGRNVGSPKSKRNSLREKKGDERAVLKGKHECEKRGGLGRAAVRQQDVWLWM